MKQQEYTASRELIGHIFAQQSFTEDFTFEIISKKAWDVFLRTIPQRKRGLSEQKNHAKIFSK